MAFHAALAQTTVFDKSEAQYRIPAIIQCSSGKIIAIGDHRYDNKDLGEGRRIDIVMKESTDGGRTWTHPERVIAGGDHAKAPSFDCAHGDAATVVDSQSGRILMLCASGGIGYWESTRQNPQMVGRYWSDDEGRTWTGSDITARMYDAMPGVEQTFCASGRICQSRQIKVGKYHRIYVAMTTRQGNRVLYSDDFGFTWNLLGTDDASLCAPNGDEAKVEELPNGDVLLGSRTSQGRFFNIFCYDNRRQARGSWGTVAFSGKDNKGVTAKDNACNGELLLVRAKDSKGKKTWLLLQSVPAGPGRTHVSIYYKPLRSKADYATPQAIAANWEGCFEVSRTTSAYSTMVQARDGSILFFYEENAYRNPAVEPDDYFDLQLRRLTISEITGGQYVSFLSSPLKNMNRNNNLISQ